MRRRDFGREEGKSGRRRGEEERERKARNRSMM
jgi:hypothetical protein